jgi:uncharacterized protein YpiB (UPF0302 family)
MRILNDNDKIVLSQLMQDDLLERVLDTITKETALGIIDTSPDEREKREDLYQLTKAIEALKGKLQECVNDSFQEE